MKRFVIERDLPGAGNLSAGQLRGVAETSCAVLRKAGTGIQWVQSFVTADRIYCHYLAENEEMVREHARQGGFPCTKVSEVVRVIDPMTAELQTA